jgi:hypothetical protein
MILLMLINAWAKDPESKIVYKKETQIDFEGLEIEGELIKPTGATINERKPAPFNPLIELRTDFNVEIKQSVETIK